SLASLQAHYHDLDLLIPEALHAVSPDGRMDIDQDPKLVNWMQSAKARGVDLPVMSMVNNYDGKDCKVPEMAAMLARPDSRERGAKQLGQSAASQPVPGIVVISEKVPVESQKNFKHLIHDLGSALHAANLKLMVALPAAVWGYDYKFFASQADAIIL